MSSYIAFILILSAGAFFCLLLGKRGAANFVGAGVSVLAGVAGLVCGGAGLMGQSWDLNLPWNVPMGSLHVGVDGLSAYFLCVVSLICSLAGLYGGGYLRTSAGKRHVGSSWCMYLLLFASMGVVVTARNAVLFLVAWEVMSLTSFFLVMFEHERQEVLRAGWTYLVATHLGTAFLLAMFLVMGGGGSLEFGQMKAPAGTAGAVFLLAVIGFGTKAGFLPLHVWLPEAHPAAPSHVSAVMSGVMIKTGIYGLFRVLEMLPAPAEWWGWTLVSIGAVSGVMGVLLALAQHDLKRLLAYCSVENIGIIAMGMGVGLLGRSSGNSAMAVLGFSGAALHVLNHAVFKSLLFMSAGSVLHATGTRQIDRLGGLLKRMGTTGTTFMLASAAICALPPLNGFVSEFCIYAGSLASISTKTLACGGVIALAALALMGGLAMACFTKAFGVVFLGEPRSQEASHAHEAGLSMRVPMLVLAGLCVVIGLAGPLAVGIVQPAIAAAAGGGDISSAAPAAWNALWYISGGGVLLAIAIALFALIRRRLLAKRTVSAGVTWDCGYALPTARMQYTASSFAMPIVSMFRYLLLPAERIRRPDGLLPSEASAETRVADPFTERTYRPIFRSVGWVAGRLRWMQQGRNQLYVLYIALALVVLLAWKLGAAT